MGMTPPAPPPGASDDPGWRRDRSPYGSGATPPPGSGPPQDAPPGHAPLGFGPPPGWGGPAPPPGYRAFGQPGFGPYGDQIDHPQGTTVLVLGILSLVVCGFLGPFAWVMGTKALKEIDLDPTRYRNRGNVVAGKVLGIISSVLLILYVVALVVFVAIVVSAVND